MFRSLLPLRRPNHSAWYKNLIYRPVERARGTTFQSLIASIHDCGVRRSKSHPLRFTMHLASPMKCECFAAQRLLPLLMTPAANRNRIGTPLSCAEVGFLVTLVVLTSIHVTWVYTV